MGNIEILQPFLVAIFVAAAASLLGVFAILKRMALVGDALSHVALPGVALALLLNLNPLFGAIVLLAFATINIWLLEGKSRLTIETIVGVFFSASLAIGALITPIEHLEEALFGDISSLGRLEAAASIILSVVIAAVLLFIRKKLIVNMVSADLAKSIGINSRAVGLVYLLIFALGVALGIRFVGALLMGSLVIIPAASAKNIAKSLRFFTVLSVLFGVFAAISGIFVSRVYGFAPGPIFILISSGVFVFSVIFREFGK